MAGPRPGVFLESVSTPILQPFQPGAEKSDAAGAIWQDGADVLIPVRVQARASRDAIEGIAAGRLRIRLTAPPVGGAANAACLAILGDRLGVPKSRLRIERGATSREKLVRVSGASVRAVLSRLSPTPDPKADR